MPHCNCSLHAFHQAMLKWLPKEGREGVWGANQKYLSPDRPDTEEWGTGGNSCGGRWRGSPGPHPESLRLRGYPGSCGNVRRMLHRVRACCIPHAWSELPALRCWPEGWKLRCLRTLLRINYLLCTPYVIKSQRERLFPSSVHRHHSAVVNRLEIGAKPFVAWNPCFHFMLNASCRYYLCCAGGRGLILIKCCYGNSTSNVGRCF